MDNQMMSNHDLTKIVNFKVKTSERLDSHVDRHLSDIIVVTSVWECPQFRMADPT